MRLQPVDDEDDVGAVGPGHGHLVAGLQLPQAGEYGPAGLGVHLGVHVESAPTLLAHRLSGYVPRIYRYPYEGEPPMMHQPAARTTFHDAALERHLADIDQLVILGAGFDTRSDRLPPAADVRCFEVDTPTTQAFKREMLTKAGVDTTRVTYVPADFETEDWFEKLVDV